PIVFVMVAGACFFGYRLTADRHAEIRNQLAERDALAEGGSIVEALAGDPEFPAARTQPS
ncbi:MAG: hypothetical protein ACK44W_18555, partial [Planctomycetota bacterium]